MPLVIVFYAFAPSSAILLLSHAQVPCAMSSLHRVTSWPNGHFTFLDYFLGKGRRFGEKPTEVIGHIHYEFLFCLSSAPRAIIEVESGTEAIYIISEVKTLLLKNDAQNFISACAKTKLPYDGRSSKKHSLYTCLF